jgi:MFS family permease
MTASFGHAVVGLPGPTAAATVAALGIANGLGRPVFGVIHDRLGVRRTVVTSFAAIAAAAGLALLAGPGFRIGYFLGFGIFWFMLGGWLAIAPAATSHLYGAAHYVRNYGIVYTAYGVGALAGGGLSGALFARFGSYDPLFLLLLALCGVGIVIAAAGLRPAT